MDYGTSPGIARYVIRTTLAFVCSCAAARAAEPQEAQRQTRTFNILVDGKERGTCTMQIGRRSDGAEIMRAKASLQFNFVVYSYVYSSSGSEVWRNGRLVEMENVADYNGTRYSVKAAATPQGLRVTVDDKTFRTESEAWLTTYWRMPDRLAMSQASASRETILASATKPAEAEMRSILLLDSDQGRQFRGELRRVGEEPLTIAGRRISCTHYRITGDVQVELWYDSSQRLVRQQSIESGHKTRLELTGIANR